jgi:hypothetical protein
MTDRAQITTWFQDGVEQRATHMIVVCDTFDWEDYPVYVPEGVDVRGVIPKYQLSAGNMQKVMEVYDLRQDMAEQVNSDEWVMNL